MLEQKRPGWRSRKRGQQWWATLKSHTFPRLGTLPVSEITSADVLDTLQPIWHARPDTARRVRQRIHSVLEWAVAMQYRTDNPCDRLGPVLGKQKKVIRHMRALPHAEVAAALAAIRATPARPVVKLAFEFMVLTAARPGEARRARWSEVDLDAAVWTVPAERMKALREHGVPLSGRAVQVLGAARTLGTGDCPLVFPTEQGKPLTDMALSRPLTQAAIATVPHGFRSPFRDWAAEKTNHPREVVEAALAHTVRDKVEAAYARSDRFERRCRLMNDWSAYLEGARGRVVAFHPADTARAGASPLGESGRRGERQSAAPSGEPDARGGNHHLPRDRDAGSWRDAVPGDDRPVEIGRVAVHENGHGTIDGEHCRPVPPAPRGHAADGQ